MLCRPAYIRFHTSNIFSNTITSASSIDIILNQVERYGNWMANEKGNSLVEEENIRLGDYQYYHEIYCKELSNAAFSMLILT
jgi:hypothetical protein